MSSTLRLLVQIKSFEKELKSYRNQVDKFLTPSLAFLYKVTIGRRTN